MKKTTSKYIAKATAAALASTMAVTGVINVAPISIVAEAASSEAEANISAFIERMYTKAMDRKSDPNGKKYWMDQVLGQTSDAASMARDFLIAAPEMKNRNLNNNDYVEVLYQTFFDRASDKAGKDYWVGELNGGKSRESVVAGFVNSKEFGNICVKYGVSQGYMNEDGTVANPGIGLFVYRLYDTLLGRKPDAQGIMYWVEQIVTGKTTIEDVATKEFIFSNEFQKMSENMTDKQYVDTLYATFFNRTPDKAGETYWRIQLASGAERGQIVYGFSDSNEFRKLLANYGLSTELKNKYTAVPETVTADQLTQTYIGWNEMGTKKYDSKDVLTYRSETLLDENGSWAGYKEYNVYDGKEYLTWSSRQERDKNGNVANSYYDSYSYEQIDGKWTLVSRWADTYVYGENWRETKYIEDYYQSYYYGEDANGVWGRISCDEYKTSQSVTEYAYNEDGTRKESTRTRVSYDRDGKESMTEKFKITFTYDDNKNLVKESYYNVDQNRVEYEYNSKYDKNNNRIEYEYKYLSGGNSIWNEETQQYESTGIELRTSWVDKYQYDDNGNQVGYEYWYMDWNTMELYKSSFGISTYKQFQDRMYQMTRDSYVTVRNYDEITHKYVYGDDHYSSGFAYDRDEYGSSTAYYSYTANEKYEKTLDYYEKYLWNNISFPTDAKVGQTFEAKTSERYDAKDKLSGYTVTSYRAYEYEAEY